MLDHMTSMLYTAFMMNNKLNVPGEILLGDKSYSFNQDWKANGWLFVATLISGFSDILFPSVVRQWPVEWRVLIVAAQFTALALWARSLSKWIQGMDEMHRRITVQAVLFSVSATFFFAMLWHRLDAAGLFRMLFANSRNPGASWDICTVSHLFLLLTLFYFAGQAIFNRRYK